MVSLAKIPLVLCSCSHIFCEGVFCLSGLCGMVLGQLCKCKIVSLGEKKNLWVSLPHFHGVPLWATGWASGWQLLEALRNVGYKKPVCTSVQGPKAGTGCCQSVQLHGKHMGLCSINGMFQHSRANDRFTFLYSSCVGVEEEEAPDIDIYHCPNCEKTHGKSTCKYPCAASP